MTNAKLANTAKPNSKLSSEQVAAELLKRKKAKRGLIQFTEHTFPQYVPAEHHKLIADKLEAVERGEIDRLMINMPPRHGKALALDTPIATPSGWTRMGDLRPGDAVFSDRGLPCNVVAVSEVWRHRPVYRVLTDDGDEILADAEHEWLVRLCRKRPAFKIKTTKQLAERTSNRAPMIEAQGALDLPERDLAIDPYVLGVWLGDGRTDSASICSADAELIEEIARIEGGYNEYAASGITRHFRPGPHYRHGATQAETLQGRLRSLGLLGSKRVPTLYARSSKAQRLSLLQGLVDTDGYVAPDGQVEFCSISEALAGDVQELVHSLGHKASIIVGRAMLNGKDCGPKYRVMFYMADAARLKRKSVKCRHGVRAFRRYVTVEFAGFADTVCIEVDSPSHMFLAGKSMLPTHNSELASRRFPAWFLGRHPDKSIIAASYNSDLATDFGRQVRNILETDEYRGLFGTTLADDSRAANRWNTKEGGAYVAAGVGTAITGRGADVLLIDDPLKDREEADSELHRQKIWDWYTSTAYTRLAPGGRIIVIQCMSGETPVLMATGEEKPLRDIRPGDEIATYDKGKVSTSFVRNWSNNGPDRIFKIRMKSGTIVKANARHPFLVSTDGGEQWIRTANLKRGDTILKVTGENGAALSALLMDANGRQSARECAIPTTVNRVGVPVIAPLLSILDQGVKRILDTATELALQSMSAFSPNKAVFAPYASSHRQIETRERTGTTSSASTIATTAERLGGFSATTATWRSDTARRRKSSMQRLDTCAIVRDEVVEVVDSGVEDVFDIQVDRTENFIANGLVSHNTRWHEDDLSGKLLAEQARGGDTWEVLELPAINNAGEALWPDFYPLKTLERTRSVLPARDWSALYQQRPTPEEGDYFKREWFRFYDQLPSHLRMYGASDYAVTDKGGDYTVHGVAGVCPDDNLYIVDVWAGQTQSNIWIESFIDLVAKHKPLNWGEEQGQIIKSLGPFIDKRMRERRVYCQRTQFTSVSDKPTRARSFQARAAMGKVYLPHNAPWVADLVGCLLQFPAGRNDDYVDMLGLIGRMLDTMVSGRVPRAPEPPESKWKRAFQARAQEDANSGWKSQ